MAAELVRPGVEVIQTFRTPTPSFVRPTLVPCVVGAAFEVVKVLNSDGTINSKAKFGPYAQLGLNIAESSYPDPRSNNDELDFLEDTIKPYMLFGGRLSELKLQNGSAFLAKFHNASKPGIKTLPFTGLGGTLPIGGTTLVIAVNQPAVNDTSEDITITFSGSGGLTPAECVEEINEAVGETIASVVDTNKVLITGSGFGAMSSITVRAGGTANSVLEVGYSGAQALERVEGAGFRVQDLSNNTTQSPWIEFYRGEYFLNGVVTAFPAKVGLIGLETGTFGAKPNGICFLSSVASHDLVPVKVGDFFYVDGVKLSEGEVAKVENTRFKIGTINTVLSVANTEGEYVSKVYDIVSFGTLFDQNAFAPKYAYFIANDLDWTKLAPVAASVTGASSGTAATQAVISSSVSSYLLTGLTLSLTITEDGVDTDSLVTFSGTFTTGADVAAAINLAGISNLIASSSGGNNLTLTSVNYGQDQAVKVNASGTANTALGLTPSQVFGTDVEFAGLSGDTLWFKLNSNPHLYEVVFTSNSLDDAVEAINTIVGATVASIAGVSNDKLKITSNLAGMSSAVSVLTPPSNDANALFGLPSSGTGASGRPYPNAYLDQALLLHISAEILRDIVTGYPLDQVNNIGSLYIQFKALRKDVSALAKDAGVLRLSDVETLSTVLDPVSEENPLALGLFLCMLNCPTFEVKGLGVDEVSAAAPEGTELAWARAASFLEAEEVYSIAPLTSNEVVHGTWMTHVGVMSDPSQGGERIVLFDKEMPTRKNPTIVQSGPQCNTTSTNNQLLLDENPSSALVDAGITPGVIAESDMLYVELEMSGEVRRYSVANVAGPLLTVRVAFTDPETNVDGFFSTVTIDAISTPVVNAAYSLKLRGTSIVIPGSSPARLDYSLVAETVSDANATFKNRRAFSVFPDVIKTTVNGLDKSLPGYYACAAIAGMCASQPPQQGFTNFPITGLTGVVGTEKFTRKQLNIIAGGGTYILQQEVQGGAVTCRHQLSTDTSSIAKRELSITKSVDFVAKFLRLAVKKFIGVNNVNDQLLDSLGTTVQAVLKFLEELGVIKGYNLNNIVQDEVSPDIILIDVTLEPLYPCNYIRLTLVV